MPPSRGSNEEIFQNAAGTKINGLKSVATISVVPLELGVMFPINHISASRIFAPLPVAIVSLIL